MKYGIRKPYPQASQAKNLTQKQLAEMLGVVPKAVSKWETGKGFPDVSLLEPLAETLNTTAEALLAGEMGLRTVAAEDMRASRFFVCPAAAA